MATRMQLQEISDLRAAKSALLHREIELLLEHKRLLRQINAIETRLQDAMVEAHGVDPTIPQIIRVLGMPRR